MNIKTPPLTGQANYQRLREIWEERGMRTMKDYLAYYNTLDVLPFCLAVSKMLQFYTARNIDLFKTCISAPGVAREIVFRSAARKAHFASFDIQNKDLYTAFRKGMCGGGGLPSFSIDNRNGIKRLFEKTRTKYAKKNCRV